MSKSQEESSMRPGSQEDKSLSFYMGSLFFVPINFDFQV